jgi:DNA-binding MarR family transcriptional regulator
MDRESRAMAGTSKNRQAGESLAEGLSSALRISFDVTIAANLMAFAGSPKNAARFGIKTREWRVLATLFRAGPATAAEIVRLIQQDKGSVSRAVGALERRGLVKRLANPRHARSPVVRLTPAGIALVESIWPVFEEQAVMMTSGLNAAEREQLYGLLDKLRRHAEGVRSRIDSQ